MEEDFTDENEILENKINSSNKNQKFKRFIYYYL